MDKLYYMGIDVGSTTVKLYVEDQEHQCIYSKYQRHYSDVKPAIESLIKEVQEHYGNLPVKVVMTGSGGLSSKCRVVWSGRGRWLRAPRPPRGRGRRQ